MIDAALAAGTVAVQPMMDMRDAVVFAGLWMTLATGALFWAVKWLLDRYKESIAEQFNALESRFDRLDTELKQDKDALHAVERSLMQLKADLPLNYVRKEDAVRHEAVFNAKLDALAAKIDAYAGRH